MVDGPARPNKLERGIAVLSSVVYEGKRKLSGMELGEISEFLPYFKELSHEMIENDYNLDFLIRSLGLSSLLAVYLKQLHTPTKRSDLLIQRLQEHTEITYSLGGIHQTGYFQSARRCYLRGIKRLARG